MKKYAITNNNVGYYVDSIGVVVGGKKEEIDDALSDAEMDIDIDWGDNWAPAAWECLHFDYDSPDTSKAGTTTLVGYLDVRKFGQQENIELEYRDAWNVEQDKIPLCIRVFVCEPEEDETETR